MQRTLELQRGIKLARIIEKIGTLKYDIEEPGLKLGKHNLTHHWWYVYEVAGVHYLGYYTKARTIFPVIVLRNHLNATTLGFNLLVPALVSSNS